MAKKLKTDRQSKKHVYGVTLYYHTNCKVIVESDEELSRNEAIDAAYSKVHSEKYQEQLVDGLQPDNDEDVAERNAEDYPFDKNGHLIEMYDHVMWHDDDTNRNNVGKVFDASRSDMIMVKASLGIVYRLLPSECIVVEV